MKGFSFAILIFLLLIGIMGCSSKHNKESDNPKQTTPSQTDKSEPLPSETASGSTPKFCNDDITSAKKVAEEYYKGTPHKVESIEYDLKNNLYDYYSSEYEKGNIITFTVKIKDSENPPRGIVLVRKDSGSDWKVIDEGY